MKPPIPVDEVARLEALHALGVLDTEPEEAFDELVELASRVCGTPISLVSLVDADRQWFKARVGVDATEMPRELAFCAHAIVQDGLFEVPDTLVDDRFADHPLVVEDPRIRFYASTPLTTGDGHNVGTLCVVDHRPRRLTADQRAILATLGRAVTAQLELRRALRRAAALTEERERAEQEQRRAAELLAAVTSISSGALANLDLRTAFERILTVLLQVTGSEFGFIGEVLRRPDGAPYLRTQAMSNIAWNEATRRLYAEHSATGMEFGKLATLFGAVMTSGEPVIANDPVSDPRSGGLPPGHPPLGSFLGAPFETGSELSGMIGLANAPGGYDRGVVERIGPILAVLGSFVASVRLERERRRTEEALRLSEEQHRLSERRFRQTLAAAQAGAWEWDFVRSKGFWSEEDFRLLGYEPGSIEPSLEALLARIHPDDRIGAQAEVERAVAAGSPFEYDYRVVRPDGSVRWLRDVGDVETDGDGRPVRVSGIVTDITERKTVERQVVEQRNQLSAANAELERTSRLKDEFLAAMSHELRTPLNAVLGLSEGLRAGVFGELTGEQSHQVSIIEDSGRHLLQLINDILDLSKIGAGKLELSIAPVDVTSICLASLRMVRESALRKRIRLSTRFDPQLQTVEGDPLRIRQILVNLLSNAVKFTPEGGAVEVEVRGDPEAQVARFTVADTGIGIAAEDLPRLFRPFVQLDGGLAREHSGTGLGLSLVQRLAELHGGGVTLETEPGAGSRFTVALPWRPDRTGPVTAADAASPGPREGSVATPVRPRSGAVETPLLLIADDHELNVHALGSYLSALGYRLAVARNGAEAVARTLAERPDLVLMDLQMPGTDGLEATRRIRASAEVGRVPVIALTALAMPGDRERALAAGADDYLAKPVELAQLADLIERHLGLRRGPR